MNGETQAQIQKFIFNLSMEQHADAHKVLKEIVDKKIQARFDTALAQIVKKNNR